MVVPLCRSFFFFVFVLFREYLKGNKTGKQEVEEEEENEREKVYMGREEGPLLALALVYQ